MGRSEGDGDQDPRPGRHHRRPLALRRQAPRRGVRIPRLLPRRRRGPHRPDFTFDGQPDGVALETLWFEDLGEGRTRLQAQSLVDSFEGRAQFLASGMETGVEHGYAKPTPSSPSSDEQRRRAPADLRGVLGDRRSDRSGGLGRPRRGPSPHRGQGDPGRRLEECREPLCVARFGPGRCCVPTSPLQRGFGAVGARSAHIPGISAVQAERRWRS